MTIHVVDGDFPQAYIQAAMQATIVGMDIETNGLWPQKGARIACVQMYVPEYGTVMARRLCEYPAQLIHLLESRKVTKVFQYAAFDISFLINELPVQPHQICDTKIAAKILDPKNEMFIHPIENKGSHSLISLVWHYYEDLLDKRVALSNWFAETLTQQQLEYAAKDVIYLPGLLKQLEREIFNKDPLLIHKLNKEYKRILQLAQSRLKETQIAA